MSIGALILQEYPFVVYQPGTPSPDPKIRINQPSLYIVDSPFSSSELMTLELLLPPSGTHINITIIYDPIYYFPTYPKNLKRPPSQTNLPWTPVVP